MAKFISIETADANRGTLLINTENIFIVAPGDESAGGADAATECTIFQNGLTSQITLVTGGGANNTGTLVAQQIRKAITANPGGQVAAVRMLDGMSITSMVIA
tara:strand:+ start:2235 stop:2543 length:309 start_codon:yes stop_codon:yes gene_type:complete